MKIKQKRFDFIYFGLFAILVSFAVYTAIDFLPSFAISSTIITPNTSNCTYEGPYNQTTGNFQCAIIPQGSNQTVPHSWDSGTNQYPSSYNSITGITGFSNFPNFNNQVNIQTPSKYDYIIHKSNGFTIGLNTDTSHIDFNSTNSANVIQSSIVALSGGGNILVKSGIYYITGHIQVNGQVSIYGEGKQNTIFIRQYNVSNDIFTVVGNYTSLKDFTIDGNAINNQSNMAEEVGITGNYFDSNIKIINYAHVGVASTGKYNKLNDCTIISNPSITGTSYGIWDATTTSILSVNNCDIENNWLSAIYAGGYTTFTNNYVSNNHRQTSPTGGGQVAADTYQNILFIVGYNTIINRGGVYTDGVEIGAKDAIIFNNYIKGQDNGITIDYNPNHIIINGNIVLNSIQRNLNTQNFVNVTSTGNFLG